MKNRWLSFLKLNKFTFGEQVVSQFVVFECKYLFSVIIFYFHKSNGRQDRFHTHAFNAISFKVWGTYKEYVLEDIGSSVNLRDDIIRYIPKNRMHCIGNSTGCCTVLFSGPWERKWLEWKDGEFTGYSWGRER